MNDSPFNNLTPKMLERLEKWKANVLPVKSADILRGKSPGNYVARSRDYGDDLSDFEALKNQILKGK